MRSAILLFLPSLAFAAPVQLTTSGRALDTVGAPISGNVPMTIGLVSDALGANVVWSESTTLAVEDGYYTVVLGMDEVGNPLEDTDLTGPVWIHLVIDDSDLGYQALHSVPSAVSAERASGFSVLATPPTCDATHLGSAYYDASSGLRLCNGTQWTGVGSTGAPVGSTPPASVQTSCLAILNAGESTGDGAYWIDPNGAPHTDAFRAWCDMTMDGGGWTVVSQNRPVFDGASTLCTTGSVGTMDVAEFGASGPAKLADATIDQIWSTGSTYEAMSRIVQDTTTPYFTGWQRACILDMKVGTNWVSSSGSPYDMADLDSTTVRCPIGSLGDHVINQAATGYCGPQYRETNNGLYFLYSVNTSYTNTSSYSCSNPNAGRTWLGYPNAGCSTGQWLVR